MSENKQISDYNALKNLVPYDKSIVIRYLMLDLKLGNWQGTNALIKEGQLNEFGDDVRMALNARVAWEKESIIHVGESATLLRLLKYFNWQTNANKEFRMSGTLEHRKVADNGSKIVLMTLPALLKLDGGTSQWATAAYLFNDARRKLPSRAPYKLKITKHAFHDYNHEMNKYNRWVPPIDATILRQAMSAIYFKHDTRAGKRMGLYPYQSEDYCFARVFDGITVADAMERFPSLANHESNRFEEVERAKAEYINTGVIASNDHRVVQALVTYAVLMKQDFKCINPGCVTKSWPKFWEFVTILQS